MEKREHFPDGKVTAEGRGHLAFPHPPLHLHPLPFPCPMSDRVTINTEDEKKEKSLYSKAPTKYY